ncbi:cytochrome-c peroxidase [Cellulophaga sp. 20_2_10]|uniref:cytochrome-c peroxidase n=1 Tax=Cellulophaga sp. 20_2_10 TaxID=2942476 RepID=UPI00201AD372|nr:cytochrome c peroxidase [Cellulophaga sp. 20_2_10]MCL5245686.1 cytochrome-c peroxidase [Cellulophaga sp. 20_2_10]
MTIQKIILYCLASVFIVFTTSCANDDNDYQKAEESILQENITSLYGSLEALQIPLENDLNNIPSDPKNPLTPEKVALGKLLFHETGLALNPIKEIGTNTYSCASCHHAAAGFQSGNLQGIGEGGFGYGAKGETRHMSIDYLETDLDVQPIKSPTILNTAYQKVMLWNGQFGGTSENTGTESNWTPNTPKERNTLGFEGIETQAIAGLGVHRLLIDIAFLENNGYKAMFDDAFPEIQESNRYSTINAGLAIAAYERIVLSSKAPFQEWLRGDQNALSPNELKGANLFFGKAECYTCHSGPGLNKTGFYALGMKDLDPSSSHITIDEATKKGRGGFTGKTEDNYKFKIPTLYNLKDAANFGHGGSFTSIKEVIEYKNKGIPENIDVPKSQLSDNFIPLNLSTEEINDLTTFVENALYDSNLSRYTPESLPSGNCFPNADSESKTDMGCN